MSNAPDGRGLAEDEFDDEIDLRDESAPEDGGGPSPIEDLAAEGQDLFAGDDDDEDDD
jgi:hypothetical protein